MQVLISLEVVICFHLKYAIDFEKVINTANKKKKNWEDFHGSPSVAFQRRPYEAAEFYRVGHSEKR